jgi:REP element-mobilizing transposase RayT
MARRQFDIPGLKFSKARSAYGGTLYKTRLGRSTPRPLATRQTMHLVLRSSKAKGAWSFLKSKNDKIVRGVIRTFAAKYGVKVLSLANVGNHLHMQIQLTNRHTYANFIRAVTGAIALKISGRDRWSHRAAKNGKLKFWDYRPFTRIITGLKQFLTLKNYIEINQWEGFGYSMAQARYMWAQAKHGRHGEGSE